MIRISAFLMAGILLSMQGILPASLIVASTAIILLVVLYLCTVLFLRRNSVTGLISGALGLTGIGVLGWLTVIVHDPLRSPEHILHNREKIIAYEVELTSVPVLKEQSWKARGRIRAICFETSWIKSAGGMQLYLRSDSTRQSPAYHDILIVAGAPDEIRSPTNPDEFDMKSYLAAEGIYHREFVGADHWTRTGSTSYDLFGYAQLARQWCQRRLDLFIPANQEHSIVDALVLGVTDDLDDELRMDYASTGVIHVLAVSGLHVGVIYGVIYFFLKGFNRSRSGRWLVAGFSIVVLWGYAFLTGLSPSVLRAVTMFSVASMAVPIQRRPNALNTLGVSAFVLLLLKPSMLLSVGFQLSYAAVLGIIVFYPVLNRFGGKQKGRLLRWLWQMTSVSLAAQLLTFPLTLYYFHQFPIYFLLANLVAIPAGTLLLIGGMVLVFISGLESAAMLLGMSLGFIVSGLNAFIQWMAEVPGNLVQGIYITGAQCILIYGLIGVLSLLWIRRRFGWVVVLFVLCCGYAAVGWSHHMQAHSARIIVYNIRDKSAMEWQEGGWSILLTDSTVTDQDIRSHIAPSWITNKVDAVHRVTFDEGMKISYIPFAGHTFLYVGQPWRGESLNMHVDYLIIGKEAMDSQEAMMAGIDFGNLITDSSNGTRWVENLSDKSKVYAVGKNGALVIE